MEVKVERIYNGCSVIGSCIDGAVQIEGRSYLNVKVCSYVLARGNPFYSETRVISSNNKDIFIRINDLDDTVDEEEAQRRLFEEHSRLIWKLKSISLN